MMGAIQPIHSDLSLPTKRAICAKCLRAQRACICACVRRVECQTEVLILQHPAEVQHVKGSARLLHLCLPQSAILIGDVFDQEKLHHYLNANGKTSVLLYPDDPSAELLDKNKSEATPESYCEHSVDSNAAFSFQTNTAATMRLVLIDASWRHSKQMLTLNPLLQQLPRYALRDMPASRYQIRHAHATDQLSTLEACTYALMQAEPHHQQLGQLLDAFDAFNHLQIQFGVNNLLRAKK